MKEADSRTREVLFSEEQRMRQIWIWLLVGMVAVISWVAFVHQIMFDDPFGTRPAPNFIVWLILAIFGIGLPWLMYSLKLTTRLERSRLVIRFRPLLTREFPLEEITSCEARTYRPLREFGGWGIRFSPKYGRAYNMSGNRGVQLHLSNDRRVLIGSQRADELARLIKQQEVGA